MLSRLYEKEMTVTSLQNLLNDVNTLVMSKSMLFDGAFTKLLERLQSLRVLINELLKQDPKQIESLLAEE